MRGTKSTAGTWASCTAGPWVFPLHGDLDDRWSAASCAVNTAARPPFAGPVAGMLEIIGQESIAGLPVSVVSVHQRVGTVRVMRRTLAAGASEQGVLGPT